ncbi:MAG TPA: hypothetical protein ENI04_01595 [Candidatus Wildermuthbacteria bacterium]|nr:hypothetical protein [Candidatus Wildermuthbacteria bacterium]
MPVSITAIAYLAGLISFILLTWRFFSYAKAENTVTSRMFFYFSSSMTVFLAITAFVTIFLYESSSALKFAVITAAFFQGLGMSFLGYMIVFLKIKSISPKIGFGIIFAITILSTVLAVFLPYEPVFDEVAAAVQWAIPLGVSIPRAVSFFLTFLPMGYIFFQQSSTASERHIKIRALGLGFIMFLAFAGSFSDFVLEQMLALGPRSSDYAFAIVFGLLVVITVFTQTKLPSYVKKV